MRFIKIILLLLGLTVFSLFVGGLYFYLSIPDLQNDVSILALGKGGEGHTAPNLTDTIIFTKIKVLNKKAYVLSLPRDTWIKEIKAKLNTAYHYGGFKMVDDSVATIIDSKVDYNIVVDFTLFKDVIDTIGGISINVENSFIDEKYPIAGKENDLCNGDKLYRCRYEVLTINQGKQIMDGETALKFVRSRNAKGDEGTDIAREKRQQKVISAIKDRILSVNFILNPKAVKSLYLTFIDHLETDVDKETFLKLVKFAIKNNLKFEFLNIPEEMLVVSQNDKKYDKQYIFLPKDGSWKEIKDWFSKKTI